MLPSRRRRTALDTVPSEVPDARPSDGSFQALDHMANWVRFADTKATILTGGLGVVLTMLITNANTAISAIKGSCPAAYIVGGLSALALISSGYTLFWLVRAISPQSNMSHRSLNRFAWPTLANATSDELAEHAKHVDVRIDAWRQVADLSALASRKFDACRRAVKGFAFLVALGVATVVAAIGFSS